jgi:Uma2 family endonuclease
MTERQASASDRPLSLEQFTAIPEDDFYRVELSRGRLVREPRPGARHGCTASNLHFLLRCFVDEHRLGRVLIETGFRLSDHPPTVRGPDVAFLSAARLPADVPDGVWALAPDLAIEIVSPSNTRGQIQDRIDDYFAAGTAEVWVADPRRRTLRVHLPGGDARALGGDDILTTPLLPGFSLPLPQIFAL